MKTIFQYILFVMVFFHPSLSQTRLSLSLSQSASNDWKTGDVKTFEVAAGIDTKQQFKIDTLDIAINARLAAGVLKESYSGGVSFLRPTDNELFGEAVIKYPLGWALDPYVSASLQTQLTEAIKYIQNKRSVSAKLWDPVTSQQSCGFAYTLKGKKDVLASRIGISLKQIRAENFTQMTDDRKTKDVIEAYKAESGIQWKTETVTAIHEYLSYSGSLDLFGTFDDLNKWTIKWLNEFQVTVWKFIAFIIKFDIGYDEKQVAELQYRQSVRLGVIGMIDN